MTTRVCVDCRWTGGSHGVPDLQQVLQLLHGPAEGRNALALATEPKRKLRRFWDLRSESVFLFENLPDVAMGQY